MDEPTTYTAFAGQRLLHSGLQAEMLRQAKAYLDAGGSETLLIFADQTGRQVDFDFRGTAEEVLARVDENRKSTGPGRPRLGVVSREVTLLPRHWEWLERQRGGISAALRRLIDDARRREPSAERAQRAREAADTMMSAIAGNLPGYEEASRSLYAKDYPRFAELIEDWPEDIRAHLARVVDQVAQLEASPLPSQA